MTPWHSEGLACLKVKAGRPVHLRLGRVCYDPPGAREAGRLWELSLGHCPPPPHCLLLILEGCHGHFLVTNRLRSEAISLPGNRAAD